ncbi:tripartite tricarboxylate transporter permease [Natronomonas sp. EA1]|uniref:tripartite tricarboxylate transporter permease n=1 Tax=Natronomonas sp. EA1 TaxID=3421655 RepID=UPI003EBD8D0B
MFGVRFAFVPESSVAALGFLLAGVALGTCSGLVPGLHANNMALLLAAVAPSLPGPPRLVAGAMLAAGVVHTFLDTVPALALGVPDPAMAAAALPGHRLVLQGRGREALRLSALGSGLAVVFAVPLAVPITAAMTRAYPTIDAHLSVVLVGVALLLVLTEPTLGGKLAGAIASGLAGGLGLATLDLPISAPLPGSVLTPLFAGLFGAPVLLDAMRGAGVPEQDDTAIALAPRVVSALAGLGALAGAAVGYLPGVSSAVAATLALVATPGRYGARGFVVATSGVDTANTIFALFALVALGTPRTGVLVAVDSLDAPLDLPFLLGSVAVAAVAGLLLVVGLGDRYLTVVGNLPPRGLSVSILLGLAGLSWLFAGTLGVGVYLLATLVGLVPVRLGCQRAHLMGVLLWPLAL